MRKETSVAITLHAEIAAHARAVTAFDLSANNKYLITVSEDSFAKIWSFYEDGNTRVS